MANYRTKPAATKGMPTGIPYIIGNEAAERFSFYGMKAVLVTFMVHHLLGPDGALDGMSEAQANSWTHLFVVAAYFTPLLGSFLSDVFWGKYKTIMILSVVYCLGHFALALDETRTGLFLGLALIALGAGGIKPCVSAHVGDQFGRSNQFRLARVFAWFYFSINAGAVVSQALTPKLLVNVGPWAAFGLPGVLMVLATAMFWLGRKSFVHIPPAGWKHFKHEFVTEGWSLIRRLGVLYFFGVSMFWALFDQCATAWVHQAAKMDRVVLGYELEPGQLLAVNPFLVLLFIPLFNYVLYPFAEKFVKVTPLRKIGSGLFLAATSFVVCAYAESLIEAGQTPSIWWQVLAYVLLTAAEILVSITALEFAYTQAPNRLKSVVMCLYLVSVAIGNTLPMAVNFFMENPDGTTKLTGVQYYLFFVFTMLAAATIFSMLARKYMPKDFVQEEDDPEADLEAEAEMH